MTGWAARHRQAGSGRRPCLVWLHGLLGSGDDWLPVLPYFAGWPQLTLDLPGHGASAALPPQPFAALSAALAQTLRGLDIGDYILIGYSLGGRLALYHACHGQDPRLRALYVEGAHPGLADAPARRQWLRHDLAWARRFAGEPQAAVLADWYRQPVFSDITPMQRADLIRLRAGNFGAGIAAMLMAGSLGRQPDLLAPLRRLTLPFGYLCGAQDAKFSALAEQTRLSWWPIPAAGHNAHRGNPQAFAAQLLSLLAPFE
ncbi:2-succinyl-6-hydroxy-2,4-cyclohexadiene-1-carboxylate synthase [Candidatus Sodalis sp. SoCistrobi]|uniref:2-succinyl-6-hydroxy-2, 4-cyclohexadiene-1-carboxylate synthase n=1 Tax=Candidatus Sodalis sp. SoCistrobi TaxID=1922216 RepID=UPI00093E9509|nr:2-succinyl-6-hydroxy-2,4-cyclohexadiene-1-carboxylate synthase [Candidatus Sodalis sp. SoCistrobi]